MNNNPGTMWKSASPEEKERMIQKMNETRQRNKKRKEIEEIKYTILREEIQRALSETDLSEIIAGVIGRAKSSGRDFEILRDTLGQKAPEKVEVDSSNIEITIE